MTQYWYKIIWEDAWVSCGKKEFSIVCGNYDDAEIKTKIIEDGETFYGEYDHANTPAFIDEILDKNDED